ncbi:MAG: SIMPL domain-containing protein [Gemmatimonadaceae bacterium]|nr:SIMPL domain-containing protein [Gemmatimonadaceae bacterium]
MTIVAVSTRTTRYLVRTALAVALFAPAVAMAQAPPRGTDGLAGAATLSASGQGEGRITPDRVSVLINVQTRAATASSAGAENARRTTAVLDALGKLGLPKEQLGTQGYSVYPEMAYDKNGGTPRVASYVVNNTVRAESRRTEQAGAIVDAALGAGANVINSLSFYASSIDAARRAAIGDAVTSARADAEAMARAAGGSLGELIELSTNGPVEHPRPMYDMAVRSKMESAPETPINPGEQSVHASVSGRWRFVAAR